MRPRCASPPQTPRPERKKAEKYLLVACTELYTHYLLGDRDLQTFTAFVLTDLINSVVVHDRYHLYDSATIGKLTHQLCVQHYPDVGIKLTTCACHPPPTRPNATCGLPRSNKRSPGASPASSAPKIVSASAAISPPQPSTASP